MKLDPNTYFIDLQNEFLKESKIALTNWNKLINSSKPNANTLTEMSAILKYISQGSSSVGFSEVSKFCAPIEEFVFLLRVHLNKLDDVARPLLIESGNELSKRLHSLEQGDFSKWAPDGLIEKVIGLTKDLQENKRVALQKPNLKIVIPSPEMAQVADTTFNADKPMNAVEISSTNNFSFSENAPSAPAEESKDKKTKARKSQSLLKVDTGKIDTVLDIVGEVVVLKNQLVHDESVRHDENANFAVIIDQLDKIVRELYEKTLSIRMTPLQSLFTKLQRIARDISVSLKKPVDIKLEGERTEVDRSVFEFLNEPMIHIVRNAVDHGIEAPMVRKERGKPETAQLLISAKQSGGQVMIEVREDGGGINRDKILEAAKTKGLIKPHIDTSAWTDDEVFRILFEPGFSTAKKLSDISGRGVGLDVVRTAVEKIGGKVDIRSRLGQGTTFRLTIPLTTAITDGVLVRIGGIRYILPINTIREFVRTEDVLFTDLNQQSKVAKIREKLYPVVDIETSLGKVDLTNYRMDKIEDTSRFSELLMIVESINGMLAMPIQEVIGQAQVVVKPLNMGMATIPEVAGAAILGDGRTVLVVDPNSFDGVLREFNSRIANEGGISGQPS